MKTVSVIMVSYNTGPVLFRSIEAVLLQENLRELIIVDNGNDRDVRARLKHLSETDARISLITGQGNVGFAMGCNLGAEEANGDYLLLLNPDCVVPTHAFSKVLNALEAHPEAWLAGCRILNPDGSEQAGSRRNLLTPAVAFVENFRLYRLLPGESGSESYFKRMNFHDEEKVEEPTFVPAISGAFMMIERERYYELGGLDEEYFFHVEDLDFCYQVHEKGGKILFVPDVAPVHYRSTSQVSDLFVEFCKARGFVRYFYKRFKGKYFPGFLGLMAVAIYGRFLVRTLSITLQSFWQRTRARQAQHAETLRRQWLNTPVKESTLLLMGLVNRENMEPVLLVGASGQVGLSILRRLLHGRSKVLAVYHDTVMDFEHPNLTWIYGDVKGRNLDLRGLKPKTLIYTPSIWTLPPHLKKLSGEGIKRLICFSSTSIMSKATSENAYEREMVEKFSEAEREVGEICKELNIQWTVIRPTMIYGIGLDKNVSSILRFMKRFHGLFPLVPPAKGLRQPVHVDDLSRAVHLSLDMPKTYGKCYNLGGSEKLTYRQLVERIAQIAKITPRLLPLAHLPKAMDALSKLLHRPDLNGEIAKRMNSDLVFDSTEAMQDFGYTPRPFMSNGEADLGLKPHKV